jgi:hypothetical protein
MGAGKSFSGENSAVRLMNFFSSPFCSHFIMLWLYQEHHRDRPHPPCPAVILLPFPLIFRYGSSYILNRRSAAPTVKDT